MSYLGGLSPIDSFFGAKSDEAKAKAQVDIAKIDADKRVRVVRAKASASKQASRTIGRWLPAAIGLVALAAVGIAVAVSSSKKRGAR